jgi:protein unc-45
MSDSSELIDSINTLLKSLNNGTKILLLQSDVDAITSAFCPTSSSEVRTTAYLVLSAFCRPASQSSPRPTEDIVSTFKSEIVSLVDGNNETDVVAGLLLLVALFQISPASATRVFVEDRFRGAITNLWDVHPVSAVLESTARLFGQAAGFKECRSVVTGDAIAWMQKEARDSPDERLRVLATVALVKYSQGLSIDTASLPAPDETRRGEEFFPLLQRALLTVDDRDTQANLVEGIAYSSRQPKIKEILSKERPLLVRLLSLVPKVKAQSSHAYSDGATLTFGVVTTILNLVEYRPRLSGEQEQVERLRRMANAGAGPSGKLEDQADDALSDDVAVRIRGRRLIDAGAHVALSLAIQFNESRGLRLVAGKALLHLIEDKENRGKILQAGGAKALMLVISNARLANTSAEELDCIQALAKLAITASPIQVFGAGEGELINGIRPLSVLLIHSSSNLLHQFEALMALTNLSSHSPALAEKVAAAEGLSSKLDLLLLEDHVLVRRAACELVCNLVAGSEVFFGRYSASKSKLQILIALTDVEDLPTRLATSGALAALTAAPATCKLLCELEFERHRVLPILAQLVDPSPSPHGADDEVEPHPGLLHRGVVCLRNFLVGSPPQNRKQIATDADMAGVVKALIRVVKANQNAGGSNVVLLPAAETLKWLLEFGVVIQM